MAVPKRKTTPSKRGMRNSHRKSIDARPLTECGDCGELKLPHHVCEGCGHYNGKKIIVTRREKRAAKEEPVE